MESSNKSSNKLIWTKMGAKPNYRITDVAVVIQRESAEFRAGWEILHRACSFLQKKKEKKRSKWLGGAGIREMIKRRASKRGRGGVRPLEPVTRRRPPPPSPNTLPLKLARGLEVTNIMDVAVAACVVRLVQPNWTQLQFISVKMAARNGGCFAPSNALMQCDFTPQRAPRLLFCKKVNLRFRCGQL